ncbi:MAG TPA: DUF1501 domain-containing protein [Chitinophagaceae bacterium]|nr:MAG: twin-arginine translocation pathway signal [Bacteroidetes bacterium OLB11]HMN32607.1 DUF1501 domain-containing protein [Chitinophagaceae bacterium]
MKRRDFLKMSTMATLAYSINGNPIHAYGENHLLSMISKSRANNDNILVLIQLSGGNDGLNTVIPLDKYSELSNARSNILIDQADVLPLNGQANTGFHPAMTGLQNLYNTERMNIVQAVSYPNPNFSHFRSTDIMFSASDSNVDIDTGWIGRYIDYRFPGAPLNYPDPNVFLDPLSIQIGSTVSALFTGSNGLNGLAVSGLNNFYQIINGNVDPAPNTPAGHELTYLRFISQQTQSYTQILQNAANLMPQNLATYPTNNNLANQLKIVARLIGGGLKTPVYMVNIGGFDTHDNQVEDADHKVGQHATRLQLLSDAIAAFQEDITMMGKQDKVAGCTVTEFGRRIKSNASIGTDHGTSAPMIVFGTKVNPTIIGTSPNLPPSATAGDNIPMQYDFRQVFGTILVDWFGVPKQDAETILNGHSFQMLPIFKYAVGLNDYTPVIPKISLEQNYPNPFKTHTNIRFTTEGGMVQILLYDEMGRMLKVLYENEVLPGSIEFSVDRSALPAGIYYYQMHISNKTLSRKMVITN